jgi:hypothetical protein
LELKMLPRLADSLGRMSDAPYLINEQSSVSELRNHSNQWCFIFKAPHEWFADN